MKSNIRNTLLCLLTHSCSFLVVLISKPIVLAQIVQDTTLPTNSIVKQDGNLIVITGGTTAGNNLFHSFQDFSVITGNTIFFNNHINTQNVISRVTGKSPSNIDGLIRVNGTANLFLINPNGIIFGKNSQLDIKGSFLATTADRLKFIDETFFDAKNPQTQSLLSVNVPVGLQMGKEPADIKVEGNGAQLLNIDRFFLPTQISDNSTGLAIGLGKTLALVGGNINLNGSIIKANRGHIELGSIRSGYVGLNLKSSEWDFNYQEVHDYHNINISNHALVSVNGSSSSIQIQGKKIQLTNGSAILSQNQDSNSSNDIIINALESFVLINNSLENLDPNVIRSESLSNGNGANILVNTKNLLIQGSGGITTASFGSAKGGDVFTNISELTNLIGISSPNQVYRAGISANAFASGNAGDIELITKYLNAENGALVQSTNLGNGAGGNVTINANSINLKGVDISAPTVLGSTTFKEGNAGIVTINTIDLKLQEGAQINSSGLASGNAGSLIINADSIKVNGYDPTSGRYSNISSSVLRPSLRTQQIFGIPSIPSGSPGEVNINAGRLSLKDGGQVSVTNEGRSIEGGKLRINAGSVSLDNKSAITGSTASGEGGDIFVNANSLQLRRGSFIVANAEANGNGGNISINTKIVTGSGNSRITADAVEGNGGNININALGLFFADSRITASSQLGINGIVKLNVLFTNFVPAKTVPTAIVEAPKIASVCPGISGAIAGHFVFRGRESALFELNKPLYNQSFLKSSFVPVEENEPLAKTRFSTIEETTQIVEAQGWVLDSNGQVTLVATKPNEVTSNSLLNSSSCSSATPVSQLFPSIETSYSDD